jgi:hypothetical protein
MVSLAEQANADCPFCPPGTGIYWLDQINGTIGSANLDGSSPTDALIDFGPAPIGGSGVALTSIALYWGADSYIGTAKLDGSSPNKTFIPAGQNNIATSPVVSGGFIYWSGFDDIGRANIDGTSPNPLFIPGPIASASTPELATDGNYIYYPSQSNSIGRVNINGGAGNDTFIPLSTTPFYFIALNPAGTKIYWTNNDNSIGVATVTGTVLTNPLLSGLGGSNSSLRGIAVDNNFIYWAESTHDPVANSYTSVIGRANLDGTNPMPNFITIQPCQLCSTSILVSGLAVAGGGSPGALVLDADGDGIADWSDNCPYMPNGPLLGTCLGDFPQGQATCHANSDCVSGKCSLSQEDTGGLGVGSAPDGIGDACQCGDVNNDGLVNLSDKTILSRSLAGLGPYGSVGSMPGFNKCDVNGDGLCNTADKTIISRAIAGLGPGIQQKCHAATTFP